MHEHIHKQIGELSNDHIDSILENMTTHALLTALLTGEELQEHDALDLMNDHIQEIVSK